MTAKHTHKNIIARRYANALFTLAKEKDAIDSLTEEVSRLSNLLETNKEIGEMLASPLIGENKRKEVLAMLIETLGCSMHISWFLGTVAANRRLGMLVEIVDSFMKMVSLYHNEHEVTVISAKEIVSAELSKLTEKLSSALDAKVKIKSQIDPSLIRGAVVKTRTMVIDSSLKTYFEKLEQHIKEA